MSTDEQRGYSKGYVAGLRKRKADRSRENIRHEKQAFWDRAFLASITTCIDVQGWKRGDELINTVEQRVRLAADIADAAVKQRKRVR